MGEDVVRRYIALRAYCRESGISRRHLQMAIYYYEESGIVDAGAVVRCGGRWYVVPDLLETWLKSQTIKWRSRQIPT